MALSSDDAKNKSSVSSVHLMLVDGWIVGFWFSRGVAESDLTCMFPRSAVQLERFSYFIPYTVKIGLTQFYYLIKTRELHRGSLVINKTRTQRRGIKFKDQSVR